jgi:hypothetical protein
MWITREFNTVTINGRAADAPKSRKDERWGVREYVELCNAREEESGFQWVTQSDAIDVVKLINIDVPDCAMCGRCLAWFVREGMNVVGDDCSRAYTGGKGLSMLPWAKSANSIADVYLQLYQPDGGPNIDVELRACKLMGFHNFCSDDDANGFTDHWPTAAVTKGLVP